MTATDYGNVVTGICRECCDEAIRALWAAGPPDWLIRYDDGDFGTVACPEMMAWHRDFPHVVCLDIPDVGPVCPDHLRRLADLVKG